jgi:hypothetical protein
MTRRTPRGPMLVLASPTAGLSPALPVTGAGAPNDPAPVLQEEEYLSVRALAARIPYREQTIRNLMNKGVFRRDVHYVKPRGRVMFRWSAVRAWLGTLP